jgi:2-polyprenyl-6-methoxyphenol hydroxylase-like FAD-dependent oxidoreductase
VDLVLAADGVQSIVRERYRDHFRPSVDVRPNRFVWLGTTKPFPAFTFYFKRDGHGLWRARLPVQPGASTFIVEARGRPGARRDSMPGGRAATSSSASGSSRTSWKDTVSSPTAPSGGRFTVRNRR